MALFDKFLKLKEELERSEVTKKVIETRKKFSKNKKHTPINIIPHQITNQKHVPTLKMDGIHVENLMKATKPQI